MKKKKMVKNRQWGSLHFKKNGLCLYCGSINNTYNVCFGSGLYRGLKKYKKTFGNFALHWVFFMSEAQDVRKMVKKRFFKKNSTNNYKKTVSETELRNFVVAYSELMEYKFTELSKKDLDNFKNLF